MSESKNKFRRVLHGKKLSCTKYVPFPYALGDTVWELCKCDDGVYRIFPMKVCAVAPYGAVRWVVGKQPTIWNIYAESSHTYMYKSVYDFGETVFRTEEEAKVALLKASQAEEGRVTDADISNK